MASIIVFTIWWPRGIVVIASIIVLWWVPTILTASIMAPTAYRIISERVTIVTVTRVARIRSYVAATSKRWRWGASSGAVRW
jgi:hypothetical protein